MVGLSAIGLAGATPIALRQFAGTMPCPALGPVPGCYVVLLCYGLTAISGLAATKKSALLFAIGIAPLLGLALIGSGMEVLGFQACPRSARDIPLCFYSLALAISLIGVYLISRVRRKPFSSD